MKVSKAGIQYRCCGFRLWKAFDGSLVKATRKSSLNDGVKEVAEIKETMKSAREGVKSSLRQETRAARLLFGTSSNNHQRRLWVWSLKKRKLGKFMSESRTELGRCSFKLDRTDQICKVFNAV